MEIVEINDYSDGHMNDLPNNLRQISGQKKHGEQGIDIHVGSTLPVAVRLNANAMYEHSSSLQPETQDLPAIPSNDGENDGCADQSKANIYNYIDSDDIKISGQRSRDQESDDQQADKEGDTSHPNHVHVDASRLRSNPLYVPGALRKDEDRNLRRILLETWRLHFRAKTRVVCAVAIIMACVVVPVIYITVHVRDLMTTSTPTDMKTETTGIKRTSGSDSVPTVEVTLWKTENPDLSATRKVSAARSRCQVGYRFIETTCIRFGLEELPYYEALLTCETEGATLAMPKSKELDVALRNLVLTEGHNYSHWIGLRKKKGLRLPKYRWQWVDGFVLRNYKGWNPRRPDNHSRINGPGQLCVSYFSRVTGYPMWNDTNCRYRNRFICQAPLA